MVDGGFFEGGDFSWRGRQAGEVEGEAADEGEWIGRGRWVKTVLALLGGDEVVDGIARPFFFGGGEFGWPGSGSDPGSNFGCP